MIGSHPRAVESIVMAKMFLCMAIARNSPEKPQAATVARSMAKVTPPISSLLLANIAFVWRLPV